MQGLERGADVAPVDRVGEVEAPGGAELAEVLLDLVERQRRVVAVGRVQQLDQLGHAARVVAEVRGDLLARVGRELQVRVVQLALQHVGGLLGGRARRPARSP